MHESLDHWIWTHIQASDTSVTVNGPMDKKQTTSAVDSDSIQLKLQSLKSTGQLSPTLKLSPRLQNRLYSTSHVHHDHTRLKYTTNGEPDQSEANKQFKIRNRPLKGTPASVIKDWDGLNAQTKLTFVYLHRKRNWSNVNNNSCWKISKYIEWNDPKTCKICIFQIKSRHQHTSLWSIHDDCGCPPRLCSDPCFFLHRARLD